MTLRTFGITEAGESTNSIVNLKIPVKYQIFKTFSFKD